MPREMLDTSILDEPLVGETPNGEAHHIYACEIAGVLGGMVSQLEDFNRNQVGLYEEGRLLIFTTQLKQPEAFVAHAAMIELFKKYRVLNDYYELGEDRPRGWEVIMKRPDHPGGFRVAYTERFSSGLRIGTQNVFYRAKGGFNN